MFTKPISVATDVYHIEQVSVERKSNHFAGFVIKDINTEERIDAHTLPPNYVKNAYLPSEVLESRDTRLVGFRSSKACSDSKRISSIQLIYFSLDQSICTDHLQPIPERMLQEPIFHGPTCSEEILVSEEFEEVI